MYLNVNGTFMRDIIQRSDFFEITKLKGKDTNINICIKKTIINLIQNLLHYQFQLLFKITLLILFPAYNKKSNCIISLKFLTIKHELQNKRYLMNFLEHMKTHLKCYLDCFSLYKNQILGQLLSRNIMDSLIVKHCFWYIFIGI
jgi:hypothetical protein